MAEGPTVNIRGSGNVATLFYPWVSCQTVEWSHHSGAGSPMRMNASWFRSRTGSTEYKDVTREASCGHHESASGPLSDLQRLRVEKFTIVANRLGHPDDDGSGESV